MTVEPFALCEARGDAVLDLGARARATLHYVLNGSGSFRIAGWPDIDAGRGTVLITPPSASHRIAADHESVCEKLRCTSLGPDWMLRSVGAGPGGIIVACSDLEASYQETEGIFDYLPEPIIVDATDRTPLRSALDQILDEVAAPGPGTKGLIRALMQQCLIHVLRHVDDERDGTSIPWVIAARDERLWAAVQTIFKNPGAAHTLASLAETAGMSRSAFAEHFSASFGRGPIELLKDVRLSIASRLLMTTDRSIKSITRSVGYNSRSYFSRAFHESFGRPPTDYRARYRT